MGLKTNKIEYDNLTTGERDALVNPPKGTVICNVTTGQLEINSGTPSVPVWDPASMTQAQKDDLSNLSGTNSGDVTLTGTPNYITIVGQAITRALVNLTSHITGILPTANGGTGTSSPNTAFNKNFGTGAGDVMEGNTTTITGTQASDITANNAKVTNATHTGEVTGSGALTVGSTAVSNKTLKSTLAGTEEVLINDGGTLKKTTSQDIADLGGGGGAKWTRSVYAYNMAVMAGTYNGVACAATSATTILNERQTFKAFDKVAEEALVISFVLPNTYTDGSDVKVTLITSDNTASEGVRWAVGLTQLASGGAFSDDTDTEYLGVTVATSVGWEAHTNSLTFSGTTLAKNEPINIIIFRDTQHAGDDLNGDAYLHQILIEEV